MTFEQLKLKNNQLLNGREWIIPGFSFIDLFNPLYCMRKPIYEFIRQQAPLISGKLLDFGCGVKPYRELFDVNEYIGIDVAESGHASNEKYADIYYKGDIIPFESDYFDAVLATQVLEHVSDLHTSIKEIYRVLLPKGLFICTVPLGENEHEIPYDFYRFTEFGLRYLFEKEGFEILIIKKSNDFDSALRYLRICNVVQKWKNSKYKKFVFIRGVFCTLWNNIWISLRVGKSTENQRYSTDILILCKKSK